MLPKSEVFCVVCGNSVFIKRHRLKTQKNFVCSKLCNSTHTAKTMKMMHSLGLRNEFYKKMAITKKGKKATLETKTKMSLAHKGNCHGFKKGQISWNLGKKHSEETKIKMGVPNKGKKATLETKTKMSVIKRKYYLTHKGHYLGKKHTVEELKKISEAGKGRKHSEETKQKMRKMALINAQKILYKGKNKNTSIELKIKQQFMDEGVGFVQQWTLGDRYSCDFYIPLLNLIVEADGFYWHSRPESIVKDFVRDAFAKSLGYSVIRIPEKIIKSRDFKVMDFLKVGGFI